MSERLKERAMYRRIRRTRLRYRKPRFLNRVSSKKEGWLAPSIQHKFDSHIRFIEYIRSIVPVTSVMVEVANFDIQKIKNPSVDGEDYQNGEQKGFFNVREYILHRDGHQCQNKNCKNKEKEPILEVHHIGYYKGDRTNRPSNLITLCTRCHTPKSHKEKGFLYGWLPTMKTFREATFMSMIRWKFVDYLKGCGINTNVTYGYITKDNRIALHLEKTHYHDAFVIAGGTKQQRIEPLYFEQVRRNNRSLEKFYDKKIYDIRDRKLKSGQELFCGRRTRNKKKNTFNLRVFRGETKTKGRRSIRREHYTIQPKDLVLWNGLRCISKGIQNKGKYLKILLCDNKTTKVVSSKEIVPYRYQKGFITL